MKKRRSKIRKKQKNQKKNRVRLKLVKVLAVIFLFVGAYHIIKTISPRDINSHSIKIDNILKVALHTNNISQDNILQSYQIEKSDKDAEWIQFVKTILIERDNYKIIKDKFSRIAGKNGFQISYNEKKYNAILTVSKNSKPINILVFKFKTSNNLLAIIVDDVGYTKNIRNFLELDIDLTYAIIPGLSYSGFLADEFSRSDIPYILHMPMEPENIKENNPGNIAFFSGMSLAEIKLTLDKALSSVKGAQGLNNHMGSKFTSDPVSVEKLMQILKEKNMFFVDSTTTNKSVGYEKAKEFGILTAKNMFFIDNKSDYKSLSDRLKKLKKIVKKNKITVAICHMTRKNTPKALKYFINEIRREGLNVDFVPLTEVLE